MQTDWQHRRTLFSVGCADADNIWALKSYCAKTFEGNGLDIDAFFKQTGYTPDMDYL